MKINIIHFGDIHVSTKGDLALRYIPALETIFQDPAVEALPTIILVAGDIAYSGRKEEYAAATKALEALQSALQKRLNVDSIPVIMVPGNHDCDLSGDQSIRDVLIDQLPARKTGVSSEPIIRACTAVQESYFAFHNKLVGIDETGGENLIYWERQISYNGNKILFRCYNTAWVSRIPEKAGSMSYPRRYMSSERNANVDITVSLLHHPTNWLTPNRKRAMEDHLNRTSDLVVFGHEHLAEEYFRSDYSGAEVGYIFGGVFQEDSNTCPGECNLLTVDLDAFAYRHISFKRKKDYFERASIVRDWHSLNRQSSFANSGFILDETFSDFLSDPGVKYIHPSGIEVSLNEIFVMPDFVVHQIGADDLGENDSISADEFEGFLEKSSCLVVLGQERSGKSCVLKRCFHEAYRIGEVPIWIDGKDISSATSEHVADLLQKAIFRIYKMPEFGLFFGQLSMRSTLFIDDFHKCKLKREQRNALLDQLRSRFKRVVISQDSNSIFEQLADGVDRLTLSEAFPRLEIQEFGRYRRRRLIGRWHSMGRQYELRNERDLEEEILATEKLVTDLLGRGILPAHPIFVLTILQSLESARNSQTVGSFGFHYESLIHKAMVEVASKTIINIRYQYATDLARYMYQGGRQEITEEELRAFHLNYCKKYRISPRQDDIVSVLEKAKIIEFYDDGYRFCYPYIFYYFAARYFRDNIEHDATKVEVRQLISRLNREVDANILIFLVHLVKSQFVLDELLAKASRVLENEKEATFEGDADFIRKANPRLEELKLNLADRESVIRTDYDRQDRLDKEASNEELTPESLIHAEIDAAFKSVQVLGQILRNFTGSLQAEEKSKIVNEGIKVGLRLLGLAFRGFEEGEEGLVEAIYQRIRGKVDASVETVKLQGMIREGLVRFAEHNAFGIIKYLSHALGVKGEGETYHEVVKPIGSRAAKLIGLSMACDAFDFRKADAITLAAEFKNDVFCLRILRRIVWNHFYVFPVPSSVKQEVCEKLGIKYSALVKLDTLKALRRS